VFFFNENLPHKATRAITTVIWTKTGVGKGRN
jgi:hypothetical protein